MEHESGSSSAPWLGLSARFITLLIAMLLVTTLAALAIPLLSAARERRRVLELWAFDFGGSSGVPLPWYARWSDSLCGASDYSGYDFVSIGTNNMALITDEKLAAITCFGNLEELWLGGDIEVTESGLRQLTKLKRLRILSLGQAPVPADVVGRLRREMPGCEIVWDGPIPERSDSPQQESLDK